MRLSYAFDEAEKRDRMAAARARLDTPADASLTPESHRTSSGAARRADLLLGSTAMYTLLHLAVLTVTVLALARFFRP